MRKKGLFLLSCSMLVFGASQVEFNISAAETTDTISAKLNTSKELGIFRDLTQEEIESYYSTLIKGDRGDSLLSNLQQVLKKGQVKLNYNSGSTKSGNENNWDGYYLLERDYEKSPLTESEISKQAVNKTGIWMNILYSTEDIYINDSINFKSGTYSFYEGSEYKTVTCSTNSVQFDREHVLPKSFGFNGANDRYENLTAGCDMQNLHAGEHNGNSTGHSNYPYGNVADKSKSQAITSGITGEIIGYTGNNKNGIKVFEPLDIDKGDIARTVFYMCARYHDYEELGNNDNTPAIRLSNNANATTTMEPEATKDSPAYYGQLDDLLEWNKLDPVDYFEIHRNNLCYNAIQKNRNPFIDYPEWADICFGNTDTGIEIGIDTGANGSLSGNYYGNTVYANVPLNTSDFELIFTDSLGNKNKLSFDDVTYKITYLNNVYDIDLKNKGFDKVGKYELTFYYESGDHKFNSKTITINVKNPYTIKIDSSTSQKTCYNVNEELDLSKLVIYKYKNGKQDGVVEDYTVEILDSEGNLLSTDKNYKFTKSGSYKVNVNYEVNGETLTTSYEVTADYTTSQLIIYGIVALVVIILLIIGYILYNKYFKKKKKSNGRKKSSTKCSSKSKKTTKK